MSQVNALPSLDKGPKSPTPVFLALNRDHMPITAPGTCARIYHRPYCDQWRIRCEVEPSSNPLRPPPQSGIRETRRLSKRGQREISDSCDYVFRDRRGYTTFKTLTLNSAARARIQDHEALGPFCKVAWKKNGKAAYSRGPDKCHGTHGGNRVLRGNTIQQEISRYFDGLQKIYKRGWIPHYQCGRKRRTKDGAPYTPITWNEHGRKLSGSKPRSDRLDYIWVIENPLNGKGKRNPHIHVMLRWDVPKSLFPQWARRLEALWGQGFAHLERIKEPSRAGAYMAKAANYLAKGSVVDQGPVKGNRYGIAHVARAPRWQPVAVYGWGNMATLMREAAESTALIVEPLRHICRGSRRRLKQLPKDAKQARANEARVLAEARKQIKATGMWFGRYQVTFQGEESLDRFLCWCQDQGWNFPKKPKGLWFSLFERSVDSQETRQRHHSTLMSDVEWFQARQHYQTFVSASA